MLERCRRRRVSRKTSFSLQGPSMTSIASSRYSDLISVSILTVLLSAPQRCTRDATNCNPSQDTRASRYASPRLPVSPSPRLPVSPSPRLGTRRFTVFIGTSSAMLGQFCLQVIPTADSATRAPPVSHMFLRCTVAQLASRSLCLRKEYTITVTMGTGAPHLMCPARSSNFAEVGTWATLIWPFFVWFSFWWG